MKVIFRTDASIEIGTGHVMRCLTLADELASRGAQCEFICRELVGNLIALIRKKGHEVHALPGPAATGLRAANECFEDDVARPPHAHWLATSQAQDAADTSACLQERPADWLIVDHYALDACWESRLKPKCRRLMAIDDLADRQHDCDLLLDQNLGRDCSDYRRLVPQECVMLCGASYVLLRPQFANLRAHSLERRRRPGLHQLLVTMGGVDKDNATGLVLQTLRGVSLPLDCRISVVMGATSPGLGDVRHAAERMPWTTTVKVGVSDMASLMADSDLAIGAAGATSWEFCCLGVPSIILVLAQNQTLVAQSLRAKGAAAVIGLNESVAASLPALLEPLLNSAQRLQSMSTAAARIVDGRGVQAVVAQMGV